MPPKRKPPAASPRKTRSMTTGKPAPPAPAKAKPEPENRGRKRAKTAAAAAVEEDGGALVGGGAGGEGGAAGGKRVVVEACTQCRQFKIRALKVKEDLESAVPGVSVTINPEKPRRGCLEIREEGGEVFISLLNMPRPFTAMKKLDMDEVIKDIAKKVA